ncbi:MAG: response regulator [Deltaproteobacteria bacterium]|nr:response regulator [Deltaproteobacteria bacterium]
MPLETRSDPADILLVEDAAEDIRATEEALRELRLPHRLQVCRDGQEALDRVRRRGQHETSPRPDLVLLDLNLPMVGGHEVLAALKNDPELRQIPVLVLSSSASSSDRDRALALGANTYLTKPVDFDEFLGLMRDIDRFWLHRGRRTAQ